MSSNFVFRWADGSTSSMGGLLTPVGASTTIATDPAGNVYYVGPKPDPDRIPAEWPGPDEEINPTALDDEDEAEL